MKMSNFLYCINFLYRIFPDISENNSQIDIGIQTMDFTKKPRKIILSKHKYNREIKITNEAYFNRLRHVEKNNFNELIFYNKRLNTVLSNTPKIF